MNERIKELAKQCATPEHFDVEKFAELILIDCLELCVGFGEEGDGYTIASEMSEYFGVEE
jgi:hypothetical protein